MPHLRTFTGGICVVRSTSRFKFEGGRWSSAAYVRGIIWEKEYGCSTSGADRYIYNGQRKEQVKKIEREVTKGPEG